MRRAARWMRGAGAAVATVGATSLVFGALLWWAPGSSRGSEAFWSWMAGFWWGVIRGDLGHSYRGYPITTLVWRGAGTTVPLVCAAVVSAVLIAAIVEGIRSTRLSPWVEPALRVLIAASTAPAFLLVYIAVVILPIPPQGLAPFLAGVAALAMGDGLLLDVSGFIHKEARSVLDKDFVAGARLRAEPVIPLVVRHVAIPVLHLAASRVHWLLGSAIVVEMCLGLQGLGLVAYRAAVHEDGPLLLAAVVFLSAALVILRLGLHTLGAALDPRPPRAALGMAAS